MEPPTGRREGRSARRKRPQAHGHGPLHRLGPSLEERLAGGPPVQGHRRALQHPRRHRRVRQRHAATLHGAEGPPGRSQARLR